MVRRTAPVLVPLARCNVDGRPIRTTPDKDQQVIPTSVDEAIISSPIITKRIKKLLEECVDYYS